MPKPTFDRKSFFDKILTSGKKTLVMGILNITPDSFSDANQYFNDVDKAAARADEMIEEGADIIDIGGESTRPGSRSVSAPEELDRILPVLRAVRKRNQKIIISIDTYKSQVAETTLENGADLVNSLSGFRFDKKLADVVARHMVPIVIYHIRGEPRSMQTGQIKYDNLLKEITDFFKEQMTFGISRGIKKSSFILDPGIGFGKTVEQNLEIIKNFSKLNKLGRPLLVGVSRKSHLGVILKDCLKLDYVPEPGDRLEAGLAETGFAVLAGAKIVRTHDVLPTKKFLAVIDRLR
ncbi:dihydropteroate synthase [Patescibacteria group bacterium]|nr:dihydropteroate synthase [Patescibacteria group bacterium]